MKIMNTQNFRDLLWRKVLSGSWGGRINLEKLLALRYVLGQPDFRLKSWVFFKPTFVKYLLIVYLEEKMNVS